MTARHYLVLVASLAGGVTACGPAPAPAPIVPPGRATSSELAGPPLVARTIAADEDRPRGAVVVGDRVAWIAGDGAIVRVAPLAGGPAKDLAIGDYAGAIAPDGDALIVAGDGLRRVPLDGGAPRELASDVGARVLRVHGAHVYLAARWADASSDVIARVPLAGGEPEVLVEDAGDVVGIDMADGFLYWTDPSDDEPLPNAHLACPRRFDLVRGKQGAAERDCDAPRAGSIWRVALAGGAVDLIASAQPAAAGVGVHGDHVYWTTFDREALLRAPRTGGAPEVVLRGRGAVLAVDDAGVVVATQGGLVVEVPAGGEAARVRGLLDVELDALALTPDEIVTVDRDRVVALSRRPASMTVIATAQGTFADLAVAGDRLTYLEVPLDADGEDRVVSIGARGGSAEVVLRTSGRDLRLGADAAHVVLASVSEGTISVDGEAPIVTDSGVLGVAIEGDTVFYVDGNRVMSVPVRGGTPTELFAQAGAGWQPGYGTRPEVELSVVDGVVHAAGFPLPGLVRGSAAGGKVVVDDVERFVAIPGGFVVANEAGISTHPEGRMLREGDGGGALSLAFDGRDVWALWGWFESEQASLYRIPLDGGAPDEVMVGRLAGELAVLDGALYLLLRDQDALLRLQL